MTRRNAIVRLVLVAALLPTLAACEQPAGATGGDTPILIDEIDGETLSRLTLSASAAERLDIATTAVEANGDGFMVPQSALIIDAEGAYWVYVNPEPLVFLREQLHDVHEADGLVYFAAGPDTGALVATQGVPELYGAEFGIGK